jgi:hypothetical protein
MNNQAIFIFCGAQLQVNWASVKRLHAQAEEAFRGSECDALKATPGAIISKSFVDPIVDEIPRPAAMGVRLILRIQSRRFSSASGLFAIWQNDTEKDQLRVQTNVFFWSYSCICCMAIHRK